MNKPSMYDVLSKKKVLTPKDWELIAEVALASSQAVAMETMYEKEMALANRIDATVTTMMSFYRDTLASAKGFKKEAEIENKKASALAKKIANS